MSSWPLVVACPTGLIYGPWTATQRGVAANTGRIPGYTKDHRYYHGLRGNIDSVCLSRKSNRENESFFISDILSLFKVEGLCAWAVCLTAQPALAPVSTCHTAPPPTPYSAIVCSPVHHGLPHLSLPLHLQFHHSALHISHCFPKWHFKLQYVTQYVLCPNGYISKCSLQGVRGLVQGSEFLKDHKY